MYPCTHVCCIYYFVFMEEICPERANRTWLLNTCHSLANSPGLPYLGSLDKRWESAYLGLKECTTRFANFIEKNLKTNHVGQQICKHSDELHLICSHYCGENSKGGNHANLRTVTGKRSSTLPRWSPLGLVCLILPDVSHFL